MPAKPRTGKEWCFSHPPSFPFSPPICYVLIQAQKLYWALGQPGGIEQNRIILMHSKYSFKFYMPVNNNWEHLSGQRRWESMVGGRNQVRRVSSRVMNKLRAAGSHITVLQPTLLLEYTVTKYAISQKASHSGHWNKYMVLECNVSQRIISYLVSNHNKKVIILCFKEWVEDDTVTVVFLKNSTPMDKKLHKWMFLDSKTT